MINPFLIPLILTKAWLDFLLEHHFVEANNMLKQADILFFSQQYKKSIRACAPKIKGK